jgi:hypothetical protein
MNRFPNEGTDRREDELARNLEGEHRADESELRADRSESRADKAASKATTNRALIDLLAVAVVALLLVVSVVAAVAFKTAGEVKGVEVQDRNASRATAYRLCSRNAVDRAFAHSRVGQQQPDAVKVLEDPLVLPILDCSPNLQGLGARPMPPREQREFVRRWEQGKLTGPERGICPNRKIGSPVSPDHC